MGYWGNAPPEMQEKEKQKGRKQSAGRGNPQILRSYPAGAYAKSDRALKTNERSIERQIPLLGGFSSYSEWREVPKGGLKRYIITP